MKLKSASFLTVIIFLFAFHPAASGQVEGDSQGRQGSALDGFFKILNEAAQESLKQGIDEFIGTYKGRIGEVKILERRGNALLLEVGYENVKRQDGVYVTGEVLTWGQALDGFSSTISPVKNKEGTVHLAIGRQAEDNSGWGLPSEDVYSDQIRLSLVRESNPERPFGSLVYDLEKNWTESSALETIEIVSTEESEEMIELADGEISEAAPGASPITDLKPLVLAPSTTLKTPVRTIADQSPSSTALPAPAKTKDTSFTLPVAKPLIRTVTEYNFFSSAADAGWKSSAGPLSFPGSENDPKGFVRTIKNGVISPGNNAVNLLQTHPQWIDGGWIEGRYPEMTLGKNVKFKAVGALLKGAENSDGVIMSISVLHEGRLHRIIRKRIDSRNYSDMTADLSSWEGKNIRLVLNVHSGNNSIQDWAVWVHPRLENH